MGPTGSVQLIAQDRELRLVVLDLSCVREESVGQSGGPADRDLGRCTDPDRNRTLAGQWLDSCVIDRVPVSSETDHFVHPKRPHEVDLFLETASAIGERFVQRLVLDIIPADTHAEAKATLAEQVDGGCLLGHEDRLTLGEDQDSGDEFQGCGSRCDEAEEYEDFMKRGLVGVTVPELFVPGQTASDDMIEGEEVAKPHALGFDRKGANIRNPVSDLRLGKYRADPDFLRIVLCGSVRG